MNEKNGGEVAVRISDWLLIGALLGAIAPLQAAPNDINFHGSLIEAPLCVINNNETIVVDFGDEVLTTRVDGEHYKMVVPISLDCSAALTVNQELSISGSGAAFDANALNSGVTDLGIALYVDGARYQLGQSVPFTYPKVPEIAAVPIKREGSTLSGGTFRALASLVVDYH